MKRCTEPEPFIIIRFCVIKWLHFNIEQTVTLFQGWRWHLEVVGDYSFYFFSPTTPWYSMFTYIKLTKVANPHILETAITNLMHFASLMTTDGPNWGQLGLISCQADRLADSWLDKTDLCFINHSLITQCLVPSPAAQALLGMLSMHCCQRWSPAPQLL